MKHRIYQNSAENATVKCIRYVSGGYYESGQIVLNDFLLANGL